MSEQLERRRRDADDLRTRSKMRSRTSATARIVLVVDDADRENEGDFIIAAETHARRP